MSKARDILKKYWGYDDFRGVQREIIESICAGRDTLGLMPTGGGKSVTFQVPALMHEGVCIVITPLIALMKDQVAHLRQKGILASAIYSGMSRSEIITVLENAIFGGVKLLYVSPERLFTDIFMVKLRHINVSFITVDEAHCISQWGYDFRPSYLKIAEIRREKPDAPVLALTATATPEVVADIQQQLGFREPNVHQMSFARANLAYIVRQAPDKADELVHILQSVGGSAIVYVRSRKRSRETAQLLNAHGISATFYHAGLEPATKDLRQQLWQEDDIRVMVATNAFGMGIDKPDVRLVIHIDCPDSPESYFQEAGRAGRDGKLSWAVLLYNNSDSRKLKKRIADTYPEKEFIREVYNQLAYFFTVGVGSGSGAVFEFDIDKFCYAYKHFPVPTDSALHILSRCGYIDYQTDPDTRPRVRFMLTRSDLNRLEQLNGNQEKVITALLRLYGGLFSDYGYIDESFLAQETGLDSNAIYLTLKELGHRRIIDFIPRKNIPLITYLQRREDGERLVIPKEVYEERREQYEHRIQCMLDYATGSTECRSVSLLRYFGEKNAKPCGKCDVCLSHRSPNAAKEKDARTRILELLADGQPRPITDLRSLHLPDKDLDAAIDYLLHEEKIIYDDTGRIKVPSPTLPEGRE